MANTMHRPPAGFVERLRKIAGIPGLEVDFDAEQADLTNEPAWGLYYKVRGERVLIGFWPRPLDGNLDAVARFLGRLDYSRNGGVEQYGKGIMDGFEAKERAKRQRRRDYLRGVADYSRDIFRAMAYGEASVGAR